MKKIWQRVTGYARNFPATVEEGEPSLLSLAQKGNRSALMNALQTRPYDPENIDMPDAAGRTLLHHLLAKGWAREAEILIERGASLSYRQTSFDGQGMNALHVAALSKSPDTLRMVLGYIDRHPDAAQLILSRYTSDKTPHDALGLALMNGDFASANILMQWGLPVNTLDALGQSRIHHLIEYGKDTEMVTSAIRFLHRHGADLDSPLNAQGETPLYTAIRMENAKAAEFLLSMGCNIDHRNKAGDPMLHKAAPSYVTKLTGLLLAYGADPNDLSRAGSTALHIAAFHNRRENVEQLLGAGVNPLIVNKGGYTADELCQSDRQKSTRNLILAKQAEWRARENNKTDRFRRRPPPRGAWPH